MLLLCMNNYVWNTPSTDLPHWNTAITCPPGFGFNDFGYSPFGTIDPYEQSASIWWQTTNYPCGKIWVLSSEQLDLLLTTLISWVVGHWPSLITIAYWSLVSWPSLPVLNSQSRYVSTTIKLSSLITGYKYRFMLTKCSFSTNHWTVICWL